MFTTIGLIGTGTMGSAVIKALKITHPDAKYLLTNRSEEKAKALTTEIGNAFVTTQKEIAANCDTIFIAVKPKNLKEVAAEIKETLAARKDKVLIISMLAGFTAQDVKDILETTQPVIFMMPNTPVLVGSGVVLYNGAGTTAEDENEFASALCAAGLVEKADALTIKAGGALTGCGPAMAYMYIEALADAVVAGGVKRDDAIKYAAAMVKGAAEMVLKTGVHPEQLKDQVCSPGGTTIQMVHKLEETTFRGSVIESMTAAINAKPKI